MNTKTKSKIEDLVAQYESFHPRKGDHGQSGLADIANSLKQKTIDVLNELLDSSEVWEEMTNHYSFKVEGGLDVDDAFQPLSDDSGRVYGFRLPDGREADLAVCLRVESPSGEEEFLISDDDLKRCGFKDLAYDSNEWAFVEMSEEE
jgi:hypothetical protein